MGCFSWLCHECGKGILSSSYSGQDCILYIIDKGKIVEIMKGKYDSYGTVFKKDGSHILFAKPISEPDEHHSNKKEKGDIIWEYAKWGDIVDMDFNDDTTSGIGAYHTKCFKGELKLEGSGNDPNQGWGDDEDEEDYFSSTTKEKIE